MAWADLNGILRDSLYSLWFDWPEANDLTLVEVDGTRTLIGGGTPFLVTSPDVARAYRTLTGREPDGRPRQVEGGRFTIPLHTSPHVPRDEVYVVPGDIMDTWSWDIETPQEPAIDHAPTPGAPAPRPMAWDFGETEARIARHYGLIDRLQRANGPSRGRE